MGLWVAGLTSVWFSGSGFASLVPLGLWVSGLLGLWVREPLFYCVSQLLGPCVSGFPGYLGHWVSAPLVLKSMILGVLWLYGYLDCLVFGPLGLWVPGCSGTIGLWSLGL